MLVLRRRVREALLIGEDIVITVTQVRGRSVRIAIDAPRSVSIGRLDRPGPRAEGTRDHLGAAVLASHSATLSDLPQAW
jgi:carbon storage regulator